MRYVRQMRGQNLDFFRNRLVLVHHKQMLAPYRAETTFDFKTRCFQVLFGNRYLQSFSQIYQFLIQLLGLHHLRWVHVLKIEADVLLLVFSKQNLQEALNAIHINKSDPSPGSCK